MTPPGTKDPKTVGDAAKAEPDAKPDDPVKPCPCDCTISATPTPLKICGTKTAKDVTATGTPAGGTFTWTSIDSGIATVTGTGKKAKVKGVKAGKTKVKATYTVAGCKCSSEIDVQVCTCTPPRMYAYGLRSITGAIGVRAKIKTRYGKICCEDEGCSTESGYNVVYANLSSSSGGKTSWAQSGYGRERSPGTTAIRKYRYAEANGNTYHVNYDPANAPAEGSVHLYQCQVDTAKGVWTYSFDGADWETFTDNKWKGRTSTNIQYTGEIFNKEDDMAGTSGNKCEFTECQFLKPQDAPKEEPAPSSVLEDFGFDESTVTPEQQAEIDAIADKVAASWKSPPEIVKIRLVGHTDPVGSAGYNIGLGQRRALAVRGALADALEAREAGLSGKVKLVTESKGESELVDTSGTDAGNARNRRVEVFLTTKGPVPAYEDAGLEAGDVQSDDPAEWGAEWISATALNIWDIQPLP